MSMKAKSELYIWKKKFTILPNKYPSFSETEKKNFQYKFFTKYLVAKENKINYISLQKHLIIHKIKHTIHKINQKTPSLSHQYIIIFLVSKLKFCILNWEKNTSCLKFTYSLIKLP